MPDDRLIVEVKITPEVNGYIEKFMKVSGMDKDRVLDLLVCVAVFFIKPDDLVFNKYTEGPYMMDPRKVERDV